MDTAEDPNARRRDGPADAKPSTVAGPLRELRRVVEKDELMSGSGGHAVEENTEREHVRAQEGLARAREHR